MSRKRGVMGTHWEDCWRNHHDCAIAKIERDKAAAPKTFEEMVQALVESHASGSNVVRALAYLGGGESALVGASVEELRRILSTIERFDSVFAPLVSDLIAKRSS